MAHHELLAKIVTLEARYTDYPTYLALRAVVELHKPEWVLPKIILRDTKPEPIAICTHCSDDQWRKSYPCPTIQKIMDELK